MRNPKLIIHTLLYKEIKLTLSLKDGSKGMPSGWDKKDYLQCHHSERNHNIKCPPSLQTLACTESIRKYNLRASITWEKKKRFVQEELLLVTSLLCNTTAAIFWDCESTRFENILANVCLCKKYFLANFFFFFWLLKGCFPNQNMTCIILSFPPFKIKT